MLISLLFLFTFSTGVFAENSLPQQSLIETVNDLVKQVNQLKVENETFKKVLVVAVKSTKCPQGWDDYKPGYGQFIRGYDREGTIDDPNRRIGSKQADSIQQHVHANMYANHSGTSPAVGYAGASDKNSAAKTGGIEGANVSGETRPKNIALLFCEKTNEN